MNPLDKWRIYLNCRDRGEPIPEDVLEYLDSVGTHLVRRGWGNIPEKPDRFAVEALGLQVARGQRSVFTSDFLNRRNRMLRAWWDGYQAGHLDSEKAAWVSELFGKPDNRQFKDDRDFYSWAAELLDIDAATVEDICQDGPRD